MRHKREDCYTYFLRVGSILCMIFFQSRNNSKCKILPIFQEIVVKSLFFSRRDVHGYKVLSKYTSKF
jgi:hypothetical protein